MIEERILPLAYTPTNHNQITDWAPFGGNTLAEIVNQHNKRQKQVWENNGYSPDDIDQFMEIIDIVRHDLNEIDKVVTKDYNSILILLADLNIDLFQQKSDQMNWVRNGLAQAQNRGKFYLTQTGQKNDSKKLVNFFRGRVQPYPTQPPHVLSAQSDFEHFLRYLHIPPDPLPVAGGNPIEDLFPPQSMINKVDLGSEQKRKEYLSAHTKIMADVRETAIEKDLSEEEVRAVARLATQEELAFQEIIRNTERSVDEHVVVDALRTPAPKLANEPFQKPDYDFVELLKFRPTRAFKDISFEQRDIFHQLGVKGDNDSVININTPETQDLVKSLGNSVSVNVFSANLPKFKIDF